MSFALTSLGRGGPYGEDVGLRVEDVLVQTEQLRVVGEEQVEVLQRLAQEEALHLVPGPRVQGVTDVVDGRVAASGDLKRWRRSVRWYKDTKCHVSGSFNNQGRTLV